MDEVSVGVDEAWKQRLAGQIDRARDWPLPAGQFFEGPGGGDLSVPDGTSPGRGVFVIHREDDAPVQDQVSLLGAHAGRLEQGIHNAARTKATPIREIGKTPAAKNHHRSRNIMTLSGKMYGYWPRVGLTL